MLREYESERSPDDSSERAQTGSKRNGENDLLSLASLVQSGNGAANQRPRLQTLAISRLEKGRGIAKLEKTHVVRVNIPPVGPSLPQRDE